MKTWRIVLEITTVVVVVGFVASTETRSGTSTHCCDAAEQPGLPGQQHCVSGSTCCASGDWSCNDATGAATCSACDDPAAEQCCDPGQEPGQQGNPPCVEGATCCSTGDWQCNDGAGNSTCALEGAACEPPCCDPVDIPNTGENPFCATGFGCCGDGRWKCNDPDGLSTCPNPGVECPRLCGGISGIPCDEPGEFCKLPAGECCCDFVGVCTEMPSACPEFLDPVCGCDGVTYDNECFADAAGVSVDHPGLCGQVCGGVTGIPCDDGEYCRLEAGQCCCDFEGTCVEVPVICPEDCDPVCGCDGRTYKNPCGAAMASVSIDHVGPCFEGNGLVSGVEFESKEKMRWGPEPDALFYNLYRFSIDSAPPLGTGECLETGIEGPSVFIPGTPAPEVVWSLLVSGQYPDGEGPLGVGWTCETRTPSVSCHPSEQLLCEATGGIWDPLSCGHYNCGQFPACDAIIPGCNCGPTRNFEVGVGCVPDPACGS